MAYVDADTFKVTRIVWGADTSTNIVLKDTAGWSVIAYPNPAQELLYISGAPNGSKARMCDAGGKAVIYHPIIVNPSAIPISNLPAGTYLLRITAPNGAIGTALIRKE